MQTPCTGPKFHVTSIRGTGRYRPTRPVPDEPKVPPSVPNALPARIARLRARDARLHAVLMTPVPRPRLQSINSEQADLGLDTALSVNGCPTDS